MKFINIKNEPGWKYVQGQPKTRIENTARVWGFGKVFGNAKIYGTSQVWANAKVGDNAKVFGNASVHNTARVGGNAMIGGDAQIGGNARIYGDSIIDGNAQIGGDGEILKTEDHMVIESPNKMPITLHRDKEIGIRINWYDFTGTIEEYIFEHRKFKNQYFHQGMIPKYYNILKNRMTPLEAERE